MAIPPEPIDEIFPLVEHIVIAEVKDILSQGVQTFIPEPEEEDTVDIPRDLPEQMVRLEVKEVIFGTLPQSEKSLKVLKPAGDYILRAGVEGPFLLQKEEDGSLTILGRYGSDTYSLRAIKGAITHRGT